MEAAAIAWALRSKGVTSQQALLHELIVSLLTDSFSTAVGLMLRG